MPMKTSLFAIVVAIASLLCACEQSKDTKWEQSLLGTWQHTEAEPNGLIMDGQTTYLPSGRMNISGSIKFQGNERQIIGSGNWQVKKGYLHYTLEVSNVSDILPNGFASADKIVSVTDKEYTYVDTTSGQTKIEYRVK